MKIYLIKKKAYSDISPLSLFGYFGNNEGLTVYTNMCLSPTAGVRNWFSRELAEEYLNNLYGTRKDWEEFFEVIEREI